MNILGGIPRGSFVIINVKGKASEKNFQLRMRYLQEPE